MMYNNVSIVAEVKTQSPFGFRSEKSWDYLFSVANEFGDIISVHTDPEWGGSWDLLKRARGLTEKPILAKGIHRNDSQVELALSIGADYVLVVGRVPFFQSQNFFIEPNSIQQLQGLSSDYKVVWNARDLKTGNPKIETFERAREIFGGWLCQASYIKNVKDIKPGANAVLVGENLEEFCNSLSRHG